jgi:hypothetical protein
MQGGHEDKLSGCFSTTFCCSNLPFVVTYPHGIRALAGDRGRRTGLRLTENNWRGLVWRQLETVSWERAVADVQPFLEPAADPGVLTWENLERVVG